METTELWNRLSPSLRRDQLIRLLRLGLAVDQNGDMAMDKKIGNASAPSNHSAKKRSNVTENQRVVILSGLVTHNPRIGTAHRTKLVLSSIDGPS